MTQRCQERRLLLPPVAARAIPEQFRGVGGAGGGGGGIEN